MLFDKPLLAGVSAAVSAWPFEGLSVVTTAFSLPVALPSTVDTEVMLRLGVRAADDYRS